MYRRLGRLLWFLEEMSISFSDLWTYLECPLAFLYRKEGVPRLDSAGSRVGNVVHNRADVGDTEEARQYQDRQFEGLDDTETIGEDGQVIPSQRARAEKQVDRLVATDARLDAADPSTDKRNEQLHAFHDTNWWFPEWATLPAHLADYKERSGWTFFTKVDQHSVNPDGGGQVLERKKGGRMQEKYKEQLYYSGTILLLNRTFKGPLHLVVRLLKAGRDVEFWYKPSKRWEQLARWRKVLAEIVANMDREIAKIRLERKFEREGGTPTAQERVILERVNFPARPVADGEWPCRECPWRHICPAKKQPAVVGDADNDNAGALVQVTTSGGAKTEDSLVA